MSACGDGLYGAVIWSLSGKKRTSHDHRKSVAVDPQRHFAIVNCGIAKGSLDHLVGARDCALADFPRWIINRRCPLLWLQQN
jgi:hypothetical protein